MKNTQRKKVLKRLENVGDSIGRARGFVGTEHAHPLRVECVPVTGSANARHWMLRWPNHLVADGTRFVPNDPAMFIAYVVDCKHRIIHDHLSF